MSRLVVVTLSLLSLCSLSLAQSVPGSCAGEILANGTLGPCNSASGGGGSHIGGGGRNSNTEAPRYQPFSLGDPRCLPGSFENGAGCITSYGGYGPTNIASYRALMDRIDGEGWTQKAANDYLAAAEKYGWPEAYYDYALVEEQLGNFDAAFTYFNNVAACGTHVGPGGVYDQLVCDLAREQAGFVQEYKGLEYLKAGDFASAELHFTLMLEYFQGQNPRGYYPGCQHYSDLELGKSLMYQPNNPAWVAENDRKREGHCDMTAAYIDLALAEEGEGKWDEANQSAQKAVENGPTTRGTKYCAASDEDFEQSCHDASAWLQAAVELLRNTYEGGEYAKAAQLLQGANTATGADWNNTMASAVKHLDNATYWDANQTNSKVNSEYHPSGLYVEYGGAELPGQYHSYQARALMASVLHVQGNNSEAEEQADIALLQHSGDPAAQLTLDTMHKKELDAALAHGAGIEHWPNRATRMTILDRDPVLDKCTSDPQSGGFICPHRSDHFLIADDEEIYIGTSPLNKNSVGGCRVAPSLTGTSGEQDCDVGWLPQADGSFWRMRSDLFEKTHCERAVNGTTSDVDCDAPSAATATPQAATGSTTNWLRQEDGSYWRIYLGSDNRWHCQISKDGQTSEVPCTQ